MAHPFINTLPDWVQPYVLYWRKILRLEHIEVRTKQTLAPHGASDSAGSAVNWPAYNIAWLEFRADIEDEKEWRETVIHEVLHVAHARVDAVVWNMLLPRLNHDAQEIGREAYRQAMESFIDSLAGTLYELTAPKAEEGGTANERSDSSNENTIDGTAGTPEGSPDPVGDGQVVLPGQRKPGEEIFLSSTRRG